MSNPFKPEEPVDIAAKAFMTSQPETPMTLEQTLNWLSPGSAYHRKQEAIEQLERLLSRELNDLSKSFKDNQNYKGYMVKQVIEERLNG